jgi:hypothetical protein
MALKPVRAAEKTATWLLKRCQTEEKGSNLPNVQVE